MPINSAVKMGKIAVFPGSFDPITVGHESVVLRALPMFDQVVVAVGHNAAKRTMFSVEQRVAMIEQVFANQPKVRVMSYEGLTVDFCRQQGAGFILRGLRTSADFEFERAVAQVNKAMHPDIETVFMLTMPEHTPISSSIIRDIVLHHGDPSKFIPKNLNLNQFIAK